MEKFLSGLLGVAATANPLLGGALTLVNQFLPSNKKLPEQATGMQIQGAYSALSPEQKKQLDERADIELAEIQGQTDKLQAMVSVEAASGNTRPFIALMMAWVVALATLGVLIILGMAVNKNDEELLRHVTTSWPLVLAILGTPTALLRSYFGMRTREKQARYSAATGQPIAQISGLKKLLS